MIAYAITDSSTLDFTHLKRDLKRFSNKASMIVYRDKRTADYATKAKEFLCHAQGFDTVLLHSDYHLAKELHAQGVHLKSTQFSDIKKAKDLGLFVVVSTHTFDEAQKAQDLGADMLTFSPIFNTPNKGEALGVEVLETLVKSLTIPVLALGGILDESQIRACEKAGAKGFASIRYFA
ncbi:MAG: thiamine phosphate synthase [Sulfurovum sp.]|nr:thiamine phosphate synthase [Sulfurovum sp.]